MTKAADKRFDGIQGVSNTTVTKDGSFLKGWEDRFEVAAEIRALAPLGRTERWKDAVEAWAGLVEDQEDDKGFRWAFLQGGIWTGHAVD